MALPLPPPVLVQQCYGPSEADTVITRFNTLSVSDQQAILDFFRSL